MCRDNSVKCAQVVDEYLSKKGLKSPLITGGGTGTYAIEASMGVHNEVQPGSFLLGDTQYGDVGMNAEEPEFEHAMWIHSAVASTVSTGGRVVIDAGSKAVDLVSGPPSLTDQGKGMGMNGDRDEGVGFTSGGDEHGILTFEGERVTPGLGETVRMLPRHIDPNCNLFDWFVAVEEGEGGNIEEGRIKGAWRITGRGVGC